MAKKSKKSKAQKEAEKKHDELLESYQSQDVLAKYVLFPNVVRYLDNVYGKNQYKLTQPLNTMRYEIKGPWQLTQEQVEEISQLGNASEKK